MPKLKIFLAALLLPTLLLPTLYGCSTAPTGPNGQPETTTSTGTDDPASALTVHEPGQQEQATVTNPADDTLLPRDQRNRPQPADGLPANATTPDPFQATLQGNDIYCFDQKVGQLKDNHVQMKLGERTVSFLPPEPGFNVENLTCHVAEWNDDNYTYSNFSYLGLEVSTQIYSPYGIYKPILTAEENNRITYKCADPIVMIDQSSEKKPHQTAVLNCQTNGLNLLTQYEFNAANGSPVMVNSNKYGVGWQKIFIKRRGNLNYFFLGNLATSMNDYWYYGDDVGQYRKKTSEESLTKLTNNPDNSQKITAWQEIVKSFNLES